jgi:hypothetical protein
MGPEEPQETFQTTGTGSVVLAVGNNHVGRETDSVQQIKMDIAESTGSFVEHLGTIFYTDCEGSAGEPVVGNVVKRLALQAVDRCVRI